MLKSQAKVNKRWKESFQELLNIWDDSDRGEGCQKGTWNYLQGRGRSALRKMKCEKAASLHGVAAEFLKKGGEAMIKKNLNVCTNVVRMLEDCRDACIEPIYSAKGQKMECYRRISLLNIPVKVLGRMVIKRVVTRAQENQVEDDQGSFLEGDGQVDQVFPLKKFAGNLWRNAETLKLYLQTWRKRRTGWI